MGLEYDDYGSADYGSDDLVFHADNRHQNVCLGKFHKMGPSTYSIHINHSVKRTVGIVYRYRQHQTDEFCLGVTICRLYKKLSVVAFRKSHQADVVDTYIFIGIVYRL